jgi:hypothetical protein
VHEVRQPRHPERAATNVGHLADDFRPEEVGEFLRILRHR